MKCGRVQQRLSNDLERLLSRREAEAVAAHLRECPACRRLRDTFLAIGTDLRVLPEPLPPAGIERRVADRWIAERSKLVPAGRSALPAKGARFPATGQPPRLRQSPSGAFRHWRSGALAAAILVAAVGLRLTARQMVPAREHREEIARGLFGVRGTCPASPGDRPPRSAGPPRPPERKGSAFAPGVVDHTGASAELRAVRQSGGAPPHSKEAGRSPLTSSPLDFAFSPSSRFRDKNAGPPPTRDDLALLNDNSLREEHRWTPVPRDLWEQIEARVRREARRGDDFIQIPFPRLAAASPRLIAAAAESYKREAAIVDPRLSREVTCAFKGTALSDLCDQLRSETGISLTAGSSVADEKVTLCCEKMPLREVMRQLSRPFGYTWLRSGKVLGVGCWVLGPTRTPDTQHPTPNAQYRYELVQDLRSQLLEEELRNRDRNAALLALEREIDRYRPYMSLMPDEALARAKTAPPEAKKLLETLSGKGWAVIQMYARLSARDQAVLRSGKQVRFMTEPGPGDQPLPAEIHRGVLQAFRDWDVVRDGDGYKMAWEPDTPGAVSAETLGLSITNAYVGLQLGQSELGRLGLHGDVYWGISGNRVGGGGSDESYVEVSSPAVARPDNRAANAALAHDASFRTRVTVSPVPGIRFPTPGDEPVRPPGVAPRTSDAEKRVTTADVLEALHRATGMPIVADYYTRLYKAESVAVRGQPLFEALTELCETMRFRWSRDAGTDGQPPHTAGDRPWLQFRSAGYYDDRLKEVPNRLLNRWVASRRKSGRLTLHDLVEIAQLPDAPLNAKEMGEGARELYGLEEWGLASNTNLRGSLRFLGQFTPDQRLAATTTAGLPFSQMPLAQQQRYIALAFETSGQPLQSLDDLTGATLRVEYTQPGWYEWGDLNHPGRGYYTRWVVPLERTPRGRRVPRPLVRERTREAALAAVRRVDPSLREALMQAVRRANPRLIDSPRAIEEDQIFPTKLDLMIVYIPGATNVRDLHVRCIDANYNPGLE